AYARRIPEDWLKVEIPQNTNIGQLVNIASPAITKLNIINNANNNAKLDKKIITDSVENLKNTVMEFNSDALLSSPVTIFLSYKNCTVNSDKEKDLRIYQLNEVNSIWELVTNTQSVDKTNKTITVTVNHFSVYRIFNAIFSEKNLENISVYPNPYIAKGTSKDTTFSNPADGTGIVFSKLTIRAKFKIYNILGELVSEFEETDGDGRYLWNTKNKDGDNLASGIYIFYITNPDDTLMKSNEGKLAIIR
ncbi:MAG: T9SS type A sorting domain-containing protein, partial [Elusimicrobia bacterium]|nr:T9SS type A sorting domain-containing protein [Elusimicrobiota bacterium]